jgi:hypothetical protein
VENFPGREGKSACLDDCPRYRAQLSDRLEIRATAARGEQVCRGIYRYLCMCVPGPNYQPRFSVATPTPDAGSGEEAVEMASVRMSWSIAFVLCNGFCFLPFVADAARFARSPKRTEADMDRCEIRHRFHVCASHHPPFAVRLACPAATPQSYCELFSVWPVSARRTP